MGQCTSLTFVVYEDNAEAEAIKANLGMPADALCAAFDLDNDPFGRKWPSHHFEMFGMIVPMPDGRPPWPWMNWRSRPSGPSFAVQIWRQRIYYGDPPMIGELRWHPDTGLSPLDIFGIRHPYDPATAEPVFKAARALHRVVSRPGRPRGSKKFPLEWFETELLRAFLEADDASIEEPAASTVWSHMRVPPGHVPLRFGTFRARLNGPSGLWPGRRWPEIREILADRAQP